MYYVCIGICIKIYIKICIAIYIRSVFGFVLRCGSALGSVLKSVLRCVLWFVLKSVLGFELIYKWHLGPGFNNRWGGRIYTEKIKKEIMIHTVHRIDSLIFLKDYHGFIICGFIKLIHIMDSHRFSLANHEFMFLIYFIDSHWFSWISIFEFMEWIFFIFFFNK